MIENFLGSNIDEIALCVGQEIGTCDFDIVINALVHYSRLTSLQTIYYDVRIKSHPLTEAVYQSFAFLSNDFQR